MTFDPSHWQQPEPNEDQRRAIPCPGCSGLMTFETYNAIGCFECKRWFGTNPDNPTLYHKNWRMVDDTLREEDLFLWTRIRPLYEL